MNGREQEIRVLRLSLYDLTDGVRSSYLWTYNDDLEALVDLPSQERDIQLKKLAKRIIKECK